MVNAILLQTFYYSVVMIFSVLGIAALLRGFLFKYLKVRASFGRYVMIKLRTALRDYFEVGWVDEGFLIYKSKGDVIRISINPNDKLFYRTLGINWIDIDEEKHAIAKTDYSPIPGYDARKNSDLIKRCLMRPVVGDTKEKVIMILLVIAIIGSLAAAYLSYMSYSTITTTTKTLPSLINNAISSASVVASSTI